MVSKGSLYECGPRYGNGDALKEAKSQEREGGGCYKGCFEPGGGSLQTIGQALSNAVRPRSEGRGDRSKSQRERDLKREQVVSCPVQWPSHQATPIILCKDQVIMVQPLHMSEMQCRPSVRLAEDFPTGSKDPPLILSSHGPPSGKRACHQLIHHSLRLLSLTAFGV